MNTKPINPSTAIMFLLKREYLAECTIDVITESDGSQTQRANHPLGYNFETWLNEHKLIVQPPTIVQPQTPKIQIIK